ncbi:MAG TPA: cellulose synthase [Trebonia sp.]|nr:cellulose synthase [Trebonia sp.]
MSYNSIEWLPLTVGLTVLGLILSYFAYKRRGLRSGMMGIAWSLLPVAAYMTGATEMLWKIGAAIGQFGSGFVFSPMKWAGIGVTGLAFALFLAAGGRTRRKASREARKVPRAGRRGETEGAPAASALAKSKTGAPGTQILPAQRQQVPAERSAAARPAKASRKAPPAGDDDMRDIEDILRKRGI